MNLARRLALSLAIGGGAMLLSVTPSMAASTPAKPHAQVAAEVAAFLMSDIGHDGILTEDDLPQGDPVPPYFYHYSIRHTDRLRSTTFGYPGYASISYPGYTMAIAIDAFLGWWAYSGDPEALQRAIDCADWIVDRRTPSTDLHADWPYSTQTDGVMGGGYDGEAVMSDKPGMFARRCLRLHDITGDVRYLDAATEIADTYVATQLSGGPSEDGRWPFRVRPSDGLVVQDYTSHLLPAILLLEEMEVREPGMGYAAAAQRAWDWIFANPLEPTSPSYMRWEGFYEDIGPESAGLRDHYSAEATAEALIARDQPGDLEAAIEIRDWSTARYMAPDGTQNGNGLYHPALLEWDAWLNTTYAATGQWAVLQLRLDEATLGTALHDTTWAVLGIEALHTLTYGQAPASSVPSDDGRMLTTIRELTQPNFGIDTWYEQNFNTLLYLLQAFDLRPELAPATENHLLGFDGGELQAVSYDAARIETQWASAGEARFKLASLPFSVQIGGEWLPAPSTGQHGTWQWDATAQVLTVQHDGSDVTLALAGATTAPLPDLSPAGQLTAAPNPFNPRVVLSYELEAPASISLWIVDARGRRVRTLRSTTAARAQGQVIWEGKDDSGRPVASGSYRAILESRGRRLTTPISLVR